MTVAISRKIRFALAFVGVVAFAFLLRLPSLYEPRWYRDEGIFASVATSLRQGDTLYADAWDNKPPLIFYTYAAIQSAFGTGMFPLHAVTTIVVIATLGLVMVIAMRLYGATMALVAGAVFTLLTCTPMIEGNLALTETFMILPTTAAMLLLVMALGRDESRRWSWLLGAGLLLGIAANFKQVAVFDAAAVAVMICLTHRRPMRVLILLATGFALPHLGFGMYFTISGAWGDYWYAVAGSLPLYNDLAGDPDPLARIAAYLPALLVVWWLAVRRREGSVVDARYMPPLWLAFALVGATSSAFAFPHYALQTAPAFALTIASLPAILPRETPPRLALTVAAGIALGVILGQFGPAIQERRQLHPLAYYENYIEYRAEQRERDEYVHFFDGSVVSVRDIVAEVEHDGAGDTMFAWSELPWLFAAGELRNPSRYYTSFLGEVLPDAKPRMLEELEGEPPAYVVVSDDAYAPFGELERWLTGRYVLLKQSNDWRLYRREPSQGTATPILADNVQSP